MASNALVIEYEQNTWHHPGALGFDAFSRQSRFIPSRESHLLQHVWEASRRAKKLDQLIVATDDFRIAEAAFAWGAEVAMTSANHASGTDRIAEVAAKAKQFAHIINIQGDEPLIDPKLIDRLVRELQRDRKLEMITAAHPFADPREAESPHQVKVVLNRKGEALYFLARADSFHARYRRALDAVFSPPGHLRLHARSPASLCPLENIAARARGIARAIARAGEWSKNQGGHDW